MKDKGKSWYADRDDRIDRMQDVKQSYKDFAVGILIQNNEPTYPHQVMILVTLNILARWCRRIIVQVPNFNFDLPGPYKGNSRAVIEQILLQSDPQINVQFKSLDESSVNCTLSIGLPGELKRDSYWIESIGWLAGCGKGGARRSNEIQISTHKSNIIGALFAAGLGNAALFRMANGLDSQSEYQIWHSLFDFETNESERNLNNPPITSSVDLGRVHLVGCGAIGSSLSFLLGLTDWSFDISLIDFDHVGFPNCSSSLIFSYDDAMKQRSKTTVCEGLLRQFGKTNVKSFESDYASFLTDHGTVADVVLCLANENSVWSSIQNNYPPIVLHATTNKNWGTNFGRHIPLKEWCIMCRFEDEIEENFVPVCSEVELVPKDSKKEVLGILPFLATSSAVIMLAELGKLGSAGYPFNDNFVEFSTRIPLGNFVIYQVKPKPCYVCKGQSQELYRKLLATRRFAESYL